MPRRKPQEMPREVWIARDAENPFGSGQVFYTGWDIEPLMPKGSPPATRYVRADLAPPKD